MKRIPLFVGRTDEKSYLREKLPFYPVVEYANERLPGGSRVLMLGSSDAHSFYWDALTFPPPLALLKESDDEKVVEGLRRIRATHVLFFKNFFERRPGETLYRHTENPGLDLYWDLEGLGRKNFLKVYEDKDVRLYRVEFMDDSNSA